MLWKLFLAFTIIPITELYLLVKAGQYIGALNTVAIVIITGFAGAYLARLQGMHTLYKIRASLQQGRIPSNELIDALLILIAGVMLLVPGFITDAAGIVLLLPQGRAVLKRLLADKIRAWMGKKTIHIHYDR